MSDDSINNNEKKNENEFLSDEDAELLEEDRERVIADSNQNDGIKHPTVLDPSIELDSHIPDRDYAEFLIDTAKKTVKREDALVRQIVYTALSKDSDNPLNLAVLAMSSEGKTHAVVETLKPFEKLDLWKIGSMSPKVIVRQNGILVDSNNEPIEERIKDLKRAIRKAEEDKDQNEEEKLSDELEQLQAESKILIDLRGKLFAFLERPREDTWEIFKTTLSHDTWEIEHPYVYDVPGMGFKVKKVVLRGWPACIYCSAKDESKSPLWPEIQSRFLVTATNSVPEKYREGNMLIAQQMSLPKSIQNQIIRSRKDIEIAEKCAMYLSLQIRSILVTRSIFGNPRRLNSLWRNTWGHS